MAGRARCLAHLQGLFCRYFPGNALSGALHALVSAVVPLLPFGLFVRRDGRGLLGSQCDCSRIFPEESAFCMVGQGGCHRVCPVPVSAAGHLALLCADSAADIPAGGPLCAYLGRGCKHGQGLFVERPFFGPYGQYACIYGGIRADGEFVDVCQDCP